MASFNIDNYLDARVLADLNRTAENSSGLSKYDELKQASEQKVAALTAIKESWVDKANLDQDSYLGSALNGAAEIGSGISTFVGKGVSLLGGGIQARILESAADDLAGIERVEGVPADSVNGISRTMQRLQERAAEARQREVRITESFDRSSIVDQTKRTQANVDLTNNFQDPWKGYTEGGQQTLGALNKGDTLEGIKGLGNIVSGMGGLVGAGAKSVIDNPRAMFGYALENVPQLATGLFGKAGAALLAGSNASYGNELYSRGVENYRSAHNGDMPPPDELKTILLASVSAAGAEQAGDALQIKGIKGGAADAAKRVKFLQSLKNIGSVGTENLLTEGGTEGYQTWAEGKAVGKDATASEIFAGTVIGGASGAQLSGGGRALAELTGATPEKAAQKKQDYADRVSHDVAIQSNDTSAYLDATLPTYSPTKAASVLVDHAKLEGTAPEVQQENLTKLREVVKTLEADQERKQDLLDHIADPQAVADAKEQLLTLKTELSRTDPASTDRVIALKQHIAFREDVVTLAGDKVAAKRLAGEVKRGADQVSATQKLQEHLSDRLRVNMPEKDLANHIALASRSVRTDDMPAITESRNSAQALINLSMVSATHLSPETALELSKKGNALTPTQRDYFRQFSIARVMENRLMPLDKVHQAVLYGNKRDIGIVDYRRTLGQALEAKDKKVADASLAQLSLFADSHAEKLKIAEDLFAKVTHSGDKQVLKVDKGGWEVVPSGKPLDKSEVEGNGGFTIHPNSVKLVDAIRAESHALNQAVREQKAAYAMVFTDMSKKVGPVDASDKPVQKEKQNVQVKPVAQTTATPSSVALVIPVVQSTTIPGSNTLSKKPVEQEERVNAKALPPSAGTEAVTSTDTTAADTKPTEQADADVAAVTAFWKAHPKTDSRSFRVLSVTEQELYNKALVRLESIFGKELSNVRFIVQADTSKAGTFFGPVGIIAINVGVFTSRISAEYASPEDRLVATISHELTHARDRSLATEVDSKGEPIYWSQQRTSLNPEGSLYKAVQAAMAKDAVLANWFAHIFKGTFDKEPYRIPRELYAQLYSLYLTKPELMNEQNGLTQAYETIKGDIEFHSQTTVETQSTDDGGRIPSGVEESTSTPDEGSTGQAGPIPGLDGRTPTERGSEVTAGGLAALVAVPKSSPDLPYRQRNLLVDHFYQKTAGITAASQRPLVMVKDFISSLGTSTSFTEFLSTNSYKATDKQNAVLWFFQEKAGTWQKKITQYLVKGDNGDAYKTKSEEDKKTFLFRNPLNWLLTLDAEGKTTVEENVTTAITYSTFGVLAELANAPVTNSKKTINTMLGRSEDATLPPSVEALLANVGTRATLVRNSAGKTVTAALGLHADKDAPQNVMVQLQGGLGAQVERLLVSLGLAILDPISSEEMSAALELIAEVDAAEKAEEGQEEDQGSTNEARKRNAKKINKGEDQFFLRVARDADGNLTQDVKDIIEAMKGSNNILDKLFSVESNLTYPSLTPPENTQKVTSSGQKIPRLLHEVNDQNRSQKSFARKDFWKLLQQGIHPDTVDALAGIVTVNNETTHITKRIGLKAKNDSISRDLNRYQDYLVNTLTDEQGNLTDTAIYFDYSVQLQQRVGVDSNVINQQASKVHRPLFYRPDWESKVDMTNPDMMNNFFMRVGEGFGIKTERTTVDPSLKAIAGILAKPEVIQAIDDLVTFNRTGKALSAEAQRNLIDVVKEGDQDLATVDALLGMAAYEEALAQKEKAFVTHIHASVDGVTNGPILAQAMFGAGTATDEESDVDSLNANMARGGISTNENQSFGDYKSDPQNKDTYEHNISTTIDHINTAVSEAINAGDTSLNEVAKAIEIFTGRLTKDDGNITSDGRGIIKGPVTQMMYGAGIPKTLSVMAEEFMAQIYEVFEQSATGVLNSAGEVKYPKAKVIAAINVLLEKGKGGAKAIMMGNNNDLLETSFDDLASVKAIKAAFLQVYQEPITKTIEENFAAFRARTTVFNQTVELIDGVYNTMYDALRQQLIDSMVSAELNKPGAGIPFENTRISAAIAATDTAKAQPEVRKNLPIRDLTEAEEGRIRKLLAPMLPVMRTLLSIESSDNKDEQYAAGILISKSTEKLSKALPYTTIVNFKPLKQNGFEVPKTGSVSVHGFEKGHAKPGVRMLPLLTQSTESYISHATQMGMQLGNTHDSVHGGLDTIHTAAEEMNKNTFHALLNYSPMQEAYNSLARTIEGLGDVLTYYQTELSKLDSAKGTAKYIRLQNEQLAVIKGLNTFLYFYGLKNQIENTEGGKNPNVLLETLKTIKSQAAEADSLKLDAMAQWTYVGQYALENMEGFTSSYAVTPEDLEKIAAKRNEVSTQIPTVLLKDAREINKHIKDVFFADSGKNQTDAIPKAVQPNKPAGKTVPKTLQQVVAVPLTASLPSVAWGTSGSSLVANLQATYEAVIADDDNDAWVAAEKGDIAARKLVNAFDAAFDKLRNAAEIRIEHISEKFPERAENLKEDLSSLLKDDPESLVRIYEEAMPFKDTHTIDMFGAKPSQQTDDMPAINETVKPRSYTTHELYNGLNKGNVSTGFDTHLQGILSSIVNKLHGAFGSFKASITENSAQDVYAGLMATGKAPFTFSLGAVGLLFSDAQMFVAEQVHATMLSALASDDGRTSVVYTELSKLFRETRARLSTPESIYEGDWATATAQEKADTTALYQRIFYNDTQVAGTDKTNDMAEFAALGLAHEGFNKLLQIPTKMAPAIMTDKTIAGMLKRLLNKVLELFNGKLTNTMAGQQADQKLKALVEKLVDLENKRISLANSTKGDFMKFVDKQAMTVRMGKKDLVSKLAHSKMFMKNKNVFIAAASGVVATLADSQVGTFFRNADTLRNEYFPGQQTMITGFLSEMNGPKPVLQAMLRAVKHFEGKRKQIITLTNKFVLQAFDNQGKDLDDQDKRAITKVLLHTGAHTLLDHFDTDKLLTLLKDPKAMSQEIASFEGQLSQFTKGQQDYFIEQSKALGYFLVTGISKVELLNKSASNIARGFNSVHDGVLSEADVKAVSKTIDALATLYAMTYTAASDTGSLVKTLEKELARTDGGNGVRVVMLSHKEMEQQSKERLFGGSEALMVKGYVPEIYNPHTSIKAATEEEGKLLLDMGYERGASVQTDPSDKGAKAKHLYVLRDGGALPWLSGFFSFTGMNSKGSSAHGQKAHRSQQALMKSKQAAVAARGPGQSGRNFDPTKVSVNHTVPLVNALGQAVDFHYMMQSNTKDTLLERDTCFDSVMGALNGSIFDKEESAVHNRKAAQMLFDEFDKGYSKEPNAYLRVSATSTDPELREIYKMLPKGTKDAIREIWGKDEMLVRSNNLDIAFGYRKRSLSNAFEKDVEDRTMLEAAFTMFTESALALYARTKKGMTSEEADRYAKRAAVYVRRGENGWQELVKITKDIIVVKSGTVTLANMYSNFILLKLYGVSTSGGLRDVRIAWTEATKYKQATERLFELESQLAAKTVVSGQADMRREVRELKDAIARNPVRALIDAGLMPTIVEDASADEDIYSYKSAATRWVDKRTAKVNPKLKEAGKQVAMAHDTAFYKGMAHFAQMGDFVARYALYQHLKTQKDVPLTETQVLQEVSDAFINYDVPMQRDIQYWDDMMVLPFTKYFVRIQRVIRGRFKYAPGKVAALLLAQSYLDMPTPLDASILFKFGNNPLSTGAFQLPGALDELATIHAGLSLFK